MSGSTRAPGSPMGDASHGEPHAGPRRGDAFVDRLADRLTAAHPPPPLDPSAADDGRAIETIPPRSRIAVEASDVRRMPDDRDDAIDFPPAGPSQPPDAFSEFEEDDLVNEHTAIDDRDGLLSESTQIYDEAPPMPVLFVESGRDQGREYVLVEGETTVGRGIDNEVILADVSVSRRHLKVVRESNVLVLRDMGSGNGTMVNGRRVSSVTLSEGDRIELGETVLVVRVPGAELAPASTSEPEVVRPPEHTTDEIMRSAGPSFEMPLSTHSEWGSLPPVAGGPSIPPPPPSSTAWVGSNERTGSVVLDRRTLLISAAGIAVGAAVLGALVVAVVMRGGGTQPQPVASTLPVETAPVAVPAYVPPVATIPTVAVQPVAPPPPVAPIPAVNPVVAAEPVVEAAVEPEPAAEEEAEPAPRLRGARPVRARPTRSTARVEPARSAPARGARGGDTVLSAYRSGDFASASRAARAGGQGALATQIDQFATHYRAAQGASRGSAQAISALERAIAIDNQIVRGGHYGARLRPQLVAAYLDSAQSAIGSRPQDACRRVQLALRLDDGARATSLGRQCEQRAQSLLGEAQGVERNDASRAIALYRAILPMVPSSSATYTRARQRIDALSRTRSVDEDE
ncbi:FHA domain-containing protein [Sandaracinus amylolyticus]|uniref:FHA domain-containing protein n=1 Tax=Sandaracinus amylolyticus TaxID=927083 RepID=UPI001F22CE30|nr:FHA domain-containing protein [Sandaracinus amylolyticus]UJR80195.1 FHA domain containing protein [Sandaracinus amylolyticus]